MISITLTQFAARSLWENMKVLRVALFGLTIVACSDDPSGSIAAQRPPADTGTGTDSGLADSGTARTAARIVAIGDSIMAWNREAGASIPDVVGAQLSAEVDNRAVGGAIFLDDNEGIPAQYVSDAWSWLLLDGGGNDVNDGCGCDDCAVLLDRLLSIDGQTGAIAAFIDQVRATGVKVAFVGYYKLPSGAQFGFDRCGDELATMRARATRMAASREGVIFVDATQAVRATDLPLYDNDLVHPSVAGSAAVGQLVADRVRAAGI